MTGIGARVRRGMAVAALSGALLAATTGIAAAAGTLDQRNSGPEDAFFGRCEGKLAQTFTAGLSGTLDTVELELFSYGAGDGTNGDLVVAIEGTDGLANPGAPDDSDVLATQTVAEGDIGSFFGDVLSVVFADPATVEAGTKYAIVISMPGCVTPEFASSGFDWGERDSDPYGGGQECTTPGALWQCEGSDFVFATYVTTVPAPPSADVRVTVSGPASAPEGAQVSYLITVTNLGPDTAHNVVLTNAVPSGSKFVGITTTRGTCVKPLKGPISCSLGDLANGDTTGSALTVKLTVRAGSTVTDLATASSTANGSGLATADPDTSNNWTSLTTNVTARTTGRPAH